MMDRRSLLAGVVLCLGPILAGPTGAQESRSLQPWANLSPSVLPEGLGLFAEQVLQLVVPQYCRKVLEILALRSRGDVSWAYTESYEAAVTHSQRIRIGRPPHDVLVVLVDERRNTCDLCDGTILGLVDLASMQAAPSIVAEGKPATLDITSSPGEGATRILFTVCYYNWSGGICTEWMVRPVLDPHDSWQLRSERQRIVKRWSTLP
jgi:hypothetical protein